MTSIIAAHSFPAMEVFNHGLGLGAQISVITHKLILKLTSVSYVVNAIASVKDINTAITKELNSENTLKLSEEDDQILKTVSNVIGTVSGLFISFIYRKLSHLMTSSSIGAEMVTNSIQELVDPILIHNKLPPLRNRAYIMTVLQGALFVVGFAQVRHNSSFIENVLLSPLLAVETVLSTVMLFAKVNK
jgi:hypothetical protein